MATCTPASSPPQTELNPRTLEVEDWPAEPLTSVRPEVGLEGEGGSRHSRGRGLQTVACALQPAAAEVLEDLLPRPLLQEQLGAAPAWGRRALWAPGTLQEAQARGPGRHAGLRMGLFYQLPGWVQSVYLCV